MSESIPLTEMQQSFVNNIVSLGCSGAEAARLAGYSDKSARIQAAQLLNNPKIQNEIRREQTKMIGGSLASKALLTLERIMDNPESPPGARVDAAKTILDRAGISAVPASREKVLASANRSISELSIDELVAFIDNGKALLEKEMRTLGNAAVSS